MSTFNELDLAGTVINQTAAEVQALGVIDID
jgi:hypothetical protein